MLSKKQGSLGAGGAGVRKTLAEAEQGLNTEIAEKSKIRELQPDQAQLTKFFSVLFKRATPGNFLSLRAFYEGVDKTFRITPVLLNGKFDAVLNKICRDAELAANARDPIVFAPPVATFTNSRHASEADLAEGPVLSVECDVYAQAAVKKLQRLLGPATLVVASGGEWVNPKTGECKPRLHIHYRLKKPAREPEELVKLKLARKLATAIVGGDASNITLVHPIRWAGSWHRKGEPRLARIVSIDARRDINLDKAFRILQKAAPNVECDEHVEHVSKKNLQTDPDLIYAAMVVIPNLGVQDGDENEWNDWNNNGMAIFSATGGADRGLEAFMMWSRKSPKNNDGKTIARWKHYFRSPPDQIGAGTIIWRANEAQPGWREEYEEQTRLNLTEAAKLRKVKQPTKQQNGAKQSKPQGSTIEPVDLWGNFEPPALPHKLLPKLIEDYAFTMGEVMGCDPAGIAMTALTVCGAAITDDINLQMKEHSKGWRESARLWIALVGLASFKKSPMASTTAKPLRKLDRDLVSGYLYALKVYKELSPEDRKDKEAPRQKRLVLGDTTVEAAQEVLADSPDGVLLYQDELSAFFGSMDKYSSPRGAAKDRGFWLESWNGGPYALNRIGRGVIMIPNLSISLLGGIQPDVIRKIAADSHDDGFLARMLTTMARPAVMSKDVPTTTIEDKYDRLIEQLTQLEPPLENFSNQPVSLRFDNGAQNLRAELERKHLELAQSFETFNKKLAAAIGKYDGYFGRLCVLFHCIEHANKKDALPMIVTENTARRVADFMHGFLFEHATAFYCGTLGLADEHDRLAAVAGYVLTHKVEELTPRDIQRGTWTMHGLKRRDVEGVLEQLEGLGWVTRIPGPRQVMHWMVNPRVHDRFAERAAKEVAQRSAARQLMTGNFAKRRRAPYS